MQESMRFAVGIDIGTTTIRCVVGHIDGAAQSPTIVGVGTSPNNGLRKGVVVNIVNTAQAIDRALDAAERMSGHQVHAASININGSHIMAMTSKGVIAVNSQNPEITEDDLARAQEAATVVQLPANREILQVTPRSYQLDGQENIKDPLGMSGVRLEVDAHVITALSPHIKNLFKSLEMTQTAVDRVMVSGLAAAKAVLSQQQMENGVAVVDIGGTTTNVILFEEGDLQHVAVLPMGSVNITNDLAIGLRTDLDIAEAVKLERASAMPSGKDAPKTFSFEHGNESHEFTTKDVDMIVGARLDEIFELIDAELASVGRSGKLPGGVVLTGGGAKLQRLAEYAKQKLRLPVRIAHLQGFNGVGDRVSGPEYATAIGLMLADVELPQSSEYSPGGSARLNATVAQGGQAAKKLFKSAHNLFKKFKA
ncbi:MAG TPA: cell division protein FtsA [Candidatus Saccharimonadales bacterium]|nr:cell division protein FtsA [Candidatus Saccharimonadales bacterium]